jgi:hypothetical protein
MHLFTGDNLLAQLRRLCTRSRSVHGGCEQAGTMPRDVFSHPGCKKPFILSTLMWA